MSIIKDQISKTEVAFCFENVQTTIELWIILLLKFAYKIIFIIVIGHICFVFILMHKSAPNKLWCNTSNIHTTILHHGGRDGSIKSIYIAPSDATIATNVKLWRKSDCSFIILIDTWKCVHFVNTTPVPNPATKRKKVRQLEM